MTEHNYYFTIPQSNVFDYVTAASLTDAKAKAFDEYGPMWQHIEWLDPEDCSVRGAEPLDDRSR